MAKKKVTKKEVRNFLGGLLGGFFGFMILQALRDTLFQNLTPFWQIVIGGLGIWATLYYFNTA